MASRARNDEEPCDCVEEIRRLDEAGMVVQSSCRVYNIIILS